MFGQANILPCIVLGIKNKGFQNVPLCKVKNNFLANHSKENILLLTSYNKI